MLGIDLANEYPFCLYYCLVRHSVNSLYYFHRVGEGELPPEGALIYLASATESSLALLIAKLFKLLVAKANQR